MEQKVGFCIDQTNASDAYTRNRIRHHVLPYLEEQVNPKAVEHMNETMEKIRQVQEWLDVLTQEAFEKCVSQESHGYCIYQEPYCEMSKVIQSLLLKRVLAECAGSEKDLEAIHITAIQELFLNILYLF